LNSRKTIDEQLRLSQSICPKSSH